MQEENIRTLLVRNNEKKKGSVTSCVSVCTTFSFSSPIQSLLVPRVAFAFFANGDLLQMIHPSQL